jgi:hypothetical protein
MAPTTNSLWKFCCPSAPPVGVNNDFSVIGFFLINHEVFPPFSNPLPR